MHPPTQHTFTHIHTLTHTHAYTHTHTCTLTHTHTHTHTQHGIEGDGYNRKSPHTTREIFEGLNVLDAAKVLKHCCHGDNYFKVLP